VIVCNEHFVRSAGVASRHSSSQVYSRLNFDFRPIGNNNIAIAHSHTRMKLDSISAYLISSSIAFKVNRDYFQSSQLKSVICFILVCNIFIILTMDQWLKTGTVGKRRTAVLKSDHIPSTSTSSNLAEENP